MNHKNPHPSVKASVRFISPEQARDLLGSNVEHQRKISKANLTKIESDLINDRWGLNGEPLIIGRSGRLLDGQHRLCASVNTKVGFWTVVVEGVDDDLFGVINIGKSRSLSDVLKINGEKNCMNLAATINRTVEYLRDARSIGLNQFVSVAEAMDTLQMMPRLRDSVAANCWLESQQVLSPGRIAWLHCLAHEECPDIAPEFFSKLQSGEMLSASSPIYLLRSRMIADKSSKARLPTREVLALLVKAWNAYAAGTQVKCLRWSVEEQFPILQLPKGRSKDRSAAR